MLQYLIILLDDTAVSFCHYSVRNKQHRLMELDVLKEGVLFAMKENLDVQIVYPKYELPQEYKDVIQMLDHKSIVPSDCESVILRAEADVVVFEGWSSLALYDFKENGIYVVRTSKKDFFEKCLMLEHPLSMATRINVVITDMEDFKGKDFDIYENRLEALSLQIEELYVRGKSSQLNLLTDRMMLDGMNNCNAGWESVALAPDGKFYVCPAFYLAGDDEDYGLGKAKFDIGDLQNGLDIKIPQLYKLDHAPLCRNCDAYQCRRCVWLNRKKTFEVNTPSHEQCVVAHLERNASRKLLDKIRRHGEFLPQREIKEIGYLDPFDRREIW